MAEKHRSEARYFGYQISLDVARGFRAICKAIQRRPESEVHAAVLAWIDLPMEKMTQAAADSAAPRLRQGASMINISPSLWNSFKQISHANGFPLRAAAGSALLNWIRMDESARSPYRQRVAEMRLDQIKDNPFMPPQGEPHVQAG